jgi:hypothetical protein
VTVGERRIDPEGLRLLDATVDAVATRFASIDLSALGEPVIGLTQQVYWDASEPGHWLPLTLAITERKANWCAAHGQAEVLWWPYELDGMDIELPLPDVHADLELRAVCEAFLSHVVADDADELVGRYFLALAGRLHDLFGVPVVTEDPDGGVVGGMDEQALAQLSAEDRAAWAARGWIDLDRPPPLHPDTVLHVPLATGLVAGIYRHGSMLFATGALAPSCGGTGLQEEVTPLGGDPAVVAGLLPHGATGARVQDLFDRWHDAETAEGAWLAVLPHQDRGGPPPVEFLAADGSVVKRAVRRRGDFVVALAYSADDPAAERDHHQESRAVLARASVTALWLAGSPTVPELRSWRGDDDGATAITLDDGTVEVAVLDGRDDMVDEPEQRALDALEQRLVPELGDRPAARAVVQATPRALPVSVEGREETFVLVGAAGAWAAAWRDRRTELHITVSGAGEPPSRLELIPARI